MSDQSPGVWLYTNTGSEINVWDVIVINEVIALASEQIPNGETGEVYAIQNKNLPKKADIEFTCGDKCFWDSTEEEITNVSSGNTYAGRISKNASSSDTEAWVDINHFP